MKIKKTTTLNEDLPNGIPDALRNFDSLPDSAHVRIQIVGALFACSIPTVYRRIKKGLIPPPEKFSEKIAAFNVGKLRRALSGTGGNHAA